MKRFIDEKFTMDNARRATKYVVVPIAAIGLGFYTVRKTGSADGLKAVTPLLVAALKYAE